MPGAQGPKTVKGAQSDANYVSRLLAGSECLGGAKIIVTSLTKEACTRQFSSASMCPADRTTCELSIKFLCALPMAVARMSS